MPDSQGRSAECTEDEVAGGFVVGAKSLPITIDLFYVSLNNVFYCSVSARVRARARFSAKLAPDEGPVIDGRELMPHMSEEMYRRSER